MKLASLKQHGRRDGRLVVVSRDLKTAIDAAPIAGTMIEAVEQWSKVAGALQEQYDQLNRGLAAGAFPFDPRQAAAPLPRAPQWIDGSVFINHGRLIEKAFGILATPDLETVPLMYQGASDDLLGAHDDIPLPSEEHGIDFEGEFGIIVGDVPMGCTEAMAPRCIRLLVQINDVSLRAFGPREMRAGFGFLQAKPSTSFAPVAVTPDEIGGAWRDARVCLDLAIEYEGNWFGHPNGGEMHFGFDRLIAHAAATRRLSAGTIIGSGTVSNAGGAKGSACIAERRAIEAIAHGEPRSRFMKFGERVRMEARCDGAPVFGAIDQRVVQAPPPEPAG